MSTRAYIKSCEDMGEVATESAQLVLTSMSENTIYRSFYPRALSEMERVLKPGGFLILNQGIPTGDMAAGGRAGRVFYPALVASSVGRLSGLQAVWDIIGVFMPLGTCFMPPQPDMTRELGNGYDHWMVFAKGDYRLRGVFGDVVPYEHRDFEFNEGMVRWMIELATDEGDLVVDPFAGTGTTGRVANLHGRDAVLYEVDPKYAPEISRKIPHAEVKL